MFATNAPIVLRKIGGRFTACREHMTRAIGSGPAPSIAGTALSLAATLLLPLVIVAIATAALMLHLHPVATIAAAGALKFSPLAIAGVAGETVDAAKIRDDLMRAFDEFKKANDERLKALEQKKAVDPLLEQKVDRLNDEITDLSKKMNRAALGGGNQGDTEADELARKQVRAFFAREGEAAAEKKATISLAFPSRIQAAQGVGSAGAGGAIVAPAFMQRLETALLFFSGMLQNSEVVTTETGADLPWPTVNDTTQAGAILAENATIGGQDVTFSSTTLKAYMYTSKLIAVSWQLLQDAAFNVDNVVADLAGQRIGRILNTHFTVGTGTAQPNGAVTAATLGKTGIVGQTLTVIYDDLVDLIHSIDVAYRPGSKWMMNDASVKVVRKLKDSQNRPLWEPSVQAGAPNMLLGYPVVINNDVAVMAANAKSILFGDFTRYKVRRVRDITLVRLNERYADNLQTGFFAYARFDGNLIDAGTHPLKYYANSAT